MSRRDNDRWYDPFKRAFLSPQVIDATRSWFANFSGFVATLFAIFITLLMYYGAWSTDTEVLRISFLLVAVVFTHVEVLICILYLHRVNLEALKLKSGNIEFEVETNADGGTPQVQSTITTSPDGGPPRISVRSEASPQEDRAGLHGGGGGSKPGTTKTVIRARTDNPGAESNVDPE